MSQANKDLVVKFFNALGSGDVATLRQVLHPDMTAIAMGTSVMSGTRGFKEVIEVAGMFDAVLRDGLHFKVVSLTAEEDRVSAELEGRSTLKDGTPYNNTYHFLVHIKDGKVFCLKEYFCSKLVDEVLVPAFARLRAA